MNWSSRWLVAAIAAMVLTSSFPTEAREIGRLGTLRALVADDFRCKKTADVTISSPSRDALFANQEDLALLAKVAGRNLASECKRLRRINFAGIAAEQAEPESLGFALKKQDWAFRKRGEDSRAGTSPAQPQSEAESDLATKKNTFERLQAQSKQVWAAERAQQTQTNREYRARNRQIGQKQKAGQADAAEALQADRDRFWEKEIARRKRFETEYKELKIELGQAHQAYRQALAAARHAQQQKHREEARKAGEAARKKRAQAEAERRAAAEHAQRTEMLQAADVPVGGKPVGTPGTVAGVWQGEAGCNFSTMGMTVALTAADSGQVTGRLRFYPLLKRDRRIRHGEFTLQGSFDPATGQVELKPGDWINRPQHERPMGLKGVVGSDGATLAGTLPGGQCGNVKLTRIALDPDAMSPPPTIERFIAGAPESWVAAATPAEKCAAWVRWGNRVPKEYSEKALQGAVDQAGSRILNVFRDEFFVPFYGKALAEFDVAESRAMLVQLKGCNGLVPVALRRQLWPYFSDLLFGGPFNNIVVSAQLKQGHDIRDRLAALAATRSWADRVLASSETLPASDASIATLTSQLDQGDKDLEVLFPSERAAFLHSLRHRRSDLALGLLQDTVADLDGLAATMVSLDDISQRKAKVDGYAEVLAEGERDRLIGTLDGRRDAILTTLMDTELKALDASGDRLADVTDNASWWSAFDAPYKDYRDTPPYRVALKRFSVARDALLRRVQPRFEAQLARIELEQNAEKITSTMLETLLPLRLDDYLAAAHTWRKLVGARLAALRQEAERRRIAAEEERRRQIREAKLARERAKFKGTHRCDELAGHPADPEGTAPGVTNDLVSANAAEAIEACLSAVEEHDRTPRFRFQLARALLRSEMYAEALPLLQAASDEEHAGATAFLGSLYEAGAGVEEDWRKAMALYEAAMQGGFRPAKTAYDAIREVHARDIFVAKGYEEPMIVAGIYEAEFESITYRTRFTKAYLNEMLQVMEPNCPVEVSPRLKTVLMRDEIDKLSSVEKAAEEGFRQLTTIFQNPGLVIQGELSSQQAQRDAAILLTRHGCDSDVTKKFLENIQAFASR